MTGGSGADRCGGWQRRVWCSRPAGSPGRRAAVSYSQQTLFSNLGYPVGVAVDASGDLFVADAGGGLGDGSLYELKPQTNGS